MPKDGEPLDEAVLLAVKRWILAGAKFDGESTSTPLSDQLPRPPYPAAPEAYRAVIPISALAIEPTTGHVIVGGYHELTIWDPTTGELVRRVPDVTERTADLTVSHDGTLLAVAGGIPGVSGEIRLVSLEDYSEVHFLGKAADVIFSAAFRPDDQQLAVGFPDQTVRIYDVASGEQVRHMESHADWVLAVAWNDDGSRLVSAGRDRTAKLFDMNDGGLLATFSQHGATGDRGRVRPGRGQDLQCGGRPKNPAMEDGRCEAGGRGRGA